MLSGGGSTLVFVGNRLLLMRNVCGDRRGMTAHFGRQYCSTSNAPGSRGTNVSLARVHAQSHASSGLTWYTVSNGACACLVHSKQRSMHGASACRASCTQRKGRSWACAVPG